MRNKTVEQTKSNIYISWASYRVPEVLRVGDRSHAIGKYAQNTLSAFSNLQLKVFLI